MVSFSSQDFVPFFLCIQIIYILYNFLSIWYPVVAVLEFTEHKYDLFLVKRKQIDTNTPSVK